MNTLVFATKGMKMAKTPFSKERLTAVVEEVAVEG